MNHHPPTNKHHPVITQPSCEADRLLEQWIACDRVSSIANIITAWFWWTLELANFVFALLTGLCCRLLLLTAAAKLRYNADTVITMTRCIFKLMERQGAR